MGTDNLGVAPDGAGFCIMCGAQLESAHRFCWSCGAPRWVPEPDDERHPIAAGAAPDERPPAVAGTPANRAVAPQESADLGVLPWFFGAGALFFLFWATQPAAQLVAPAGRAQLMQGFAKQGYGAADQPLMLAVYGFLVLGGFLVAAGLHATAFYGLRKVRRWGWLAAVVIAGFWSLLVVGIPVLRRLLSPPVRHAYGVD
ncbi:MAG: zinc ribbon domain-containing protein [Candidatus Dormibacteraeota bacterium]|nr:zinc ribbon domain-containing protein [Candidatus Dormibacteraeota bacterium]